MEMRRQTERVKLKMDKSLLQKESHKVRDVGVKKKKNLRHKRF